MYDIQMITNKQSDLNKPFEVTIKIIPEQQMAKQLEAIFTQNKHYLSIFKNPLFWLLNASPMFVYIKSFLSETDIGIQLIQLNQVMTFNFEKKSEIKHFKRQAHHVLTKLIDNKVIQMKGENNPINKIALKNEP